MAFAVVGPLAGGVGVVDDQAEVGAAAGGHILKHLVVAVGVAECDHRLAADVAKDADGLALLVADEEDAGLAVEAGRAVLVALGDFDLAADDLPGRDSVDGFRPGAHAVDAAAGDDPGLEVVRA